ncbi:replication initiation and membrane attachment family protein [Cytobacillus kochii]|uniref:replication initiation and membrane attachment family protein n=1 Tax=Cytobacillus kochii TaxID=859143 RepID=UPI00204243DE|nr:replication initiation and membrane attachment family protein [Cytobacillus kochii]MCM3323131.1 replication initiation and membrane attachment family protein [Cytobacillus kochii]MCM3345526.1 replication initiation and membrane attachment family protein [Cytobacillus kochii]
MAQHWTEVIPSDHYTVALNGLLHDYDRKILVFLYQPLIGTIAYSLYMTLWMEVEENRIWSSSSRNHHGLMSMMDLSLKEIYEARKKLEGIGLLKVYVKEGENREFIYQLQPPLSPSTFFLDGMLNIFLYKKIGKTQYTRLKRFFSDEEYSNLPLDYKDVTTAFHEVYTSGHQLAKEYNDDLSVSPKGEWVDRMEANKIQIPWQTFNFSLLEAGLSESLVPRKALTQTVKDAISNLAFLYDIDVMEMKNIIISAMNEDDEVEMDELRKSARDWYQMNHRDELPSLITQTQPVHSLSITEKPKSKEEELIQYFDTTSPIQFLKDLSGGAEPSKAELKILEDVMFHQKLPPGVMNVLIDYVMRKTDKKLTKAYVETIASHWARKSIQTTANAMALAKKEHQQYLKWAENKKVGKRSSKSNTKKAVTRTELLPDWFDEETSKNETVDQQKQDKKDDHVDLNMKEFQELMKRRNGGGQ